MTFKMIQTAEIEGHDKKYEWVAGYFSSIREAREELNLIERYPLGPTATTRKTNARTVEIKAENIIITCTMTKA